MTDPGLAKGGQVIEKAGVFPTQQSQVHHDTLGSFRYFIRVSRVIDFICTEYVPGMTHINELLLASLSVIKNFTIDLPDVSGCSITSIY